jgi:hypothetical protein
MGVQVNRIEKEFILTNLIHQKEEVSVHGHRKETRCRILSFTEELLVFQNAEATNIAFSRDEDVRVFFAYHSNYYTFASRVTAWSDGELTVLNPKSIYRDPRRKYERVKLAGIRLFFRLEDDKPELDFPKTETFTMVENLEIPDSVDPRGIGELIASFRASLQGTASDHRIVMYRDQKPQTFEELITVKTGKALWIPSTDDDFPLNDPGFSGNVIVKKEVEEYFADTGTPPYLVRSEISNLLYTKAKSGVLSEVYCPILYQEYAVGYIWVVSKKPGTTLFDGDFLEYVVQFSRVLSHSLEVNGYYRQARKTEVEHDLPVIDVSASGLLFAAASPELDTKLDLFHDMTFRMDLGGRSVSLGTRIMRKFNDGANHYFAAQFLDVKDEDLNFIFEYLYGKPFDGKAQAAWEGGAPPPPFPAEPEHQP